MYNLTELTWIEAIFINNLARIHGFLEKLSNFYFTYNNFGLQLHINAH
jgi:hypothetical protein